MSERRGNEYLWILQQTFGENAVKVEAMESQTEWNTTFYETVVYIKPLLLKALKAAKPLRDEQPRLDEYLENGIASCMDLDPIGIGESFDEAVASLHDYCFQNGLL